MRKYRHGAHSVFNLKVHLVLVVAYRRKVIDGELLTVLDTLFRHICEEEGVALLEFSGEADHVHLLLDMNPNVKPADLVGRLKSLTSRHIRKHYWNKIRHMLWGSKFWSASYCMISVGDGATIEIVERYIRGQIKPS